MNKTSKLSFLTFILLLSACEQSVSTESPEVNSSSSSHTSEAGLSPDEGLLDQIHVQNSSSSISSSFTSSSSHSNMQLRDIQLLSSLNAIQLPSFSDKGIHIMQFQNTNDLGVLSINWDGSTQWIHTETGLQYAFLTGYGSHQASILNYSTSWPFYIDGQTSSLSGNNYYKEYLTSNEMGLFWVDYGIVSTGGGSLGGGGGRQSSSSTDLQGSILFQAWGTSIIDTIINSNGYKGRLDASNTHLVWVEYAPNTTHGTIKYLDLISKQWGIASESDYHQDRPAVDGDYLVWEEYIDDNNSVIRSYQFSTGLVKDLSSRRGFRTNPDIHQGRSVWEDQRSGNGDIWAYDLIHGDTEQALVQGEGHSASVRLYQDKVFWIESNNNGMGLVMGCW